MKSNTIDLASVDLNLLVALHLLIEERSVRGAARRAHVTPSAMSHSLGRLRVLFDDALLVRAGQSLVLTPRAEALLTPVQAVLADVQRVLSPPTPFDPASLQGAFRLVCTDHVSTVLLPHVAALLTAEAPAADLYECPLQPELMEQLRMGDVDAAIGIFDNAPPEVRMRRLFTDGFVTVARVGHPRVHQQLSLETFLAEDHLLVAPRGTPTGTIDTILAQQGQQRRIARTVPHFLSAMWHVVESDLLLTISRRLVAATAHRLPVQVFPTPLPVEDYVLRLVWHPRTDQAPAQVWFRSLLLRAAASIAIPQTDEAASPETPPLRSNTAAPTAARAPRGAG